MQNTDKGNYWTILLFEDNIQKNPRWLYRLLETHLRFAVSPYHDKDIWTEEDKEKHPERDIIPGTPKKAHYHVLIKADQNTTYKTMKDLCEELGLPRPEVCRAPYGMYKYLWHQDRPDKYQYDQNDVKHYNGCDPFDFIIEPNKYEITMMTEELILFMRRNVFLHYADFLLSIQENFGDVRYRWVAQNRTAVFKEILKDNLKDEFMLGNKKKKKQATDQAPQANH